MDNLAKVRQFLKQRSESGQWNDLISLRSNTLSKSRLAAASTIPRSAFYQSHEIVKEIAKVEARLRKHGPLQDQSEPLQLKRASVVEITSELDKLNMRICAIEKGNKDLKSRLLALSIQAQRYEIGGAS